MNTIKKIYFFLILISINSFLIAAKSDTHINEEQKPLTPAQLELKKNHPLYFAVEMNEYDEVVRLLEQGYNVEGKDSRSPLHRAVRNNDVDIVELLLRHGADVNKKDYYGYTPLLQAAYWNDYEAAELLLKWKANLNIQDLSGDTALLLAVYYGHDNIISLLLKAGAAVNIQNNSGNTALHYAADVRYESFSRLILTIVCPPALLFNRYHPEQDDIVKILITAGADVNIVNGHNQTPLFNAIKNDFNKVVKLLLQAHASVDIYDDKGKSVFGYIENKKLLKMLQKYRQHNKKYKVKP